MSPEIQGPSLQLPAAAPVANPPARVPVAQPAIKAPKIAPAPELGQPDVVEDLLSPPSLRSFAWSIGAHSIFT